MKTKKRMIGWTLAGALVALAAFVPVFGDDAAKDDKEQAMKKPMKMTEEQKAKLDPQAYHVLCEEGTEPAFTGMYWDTKTPGTYLCAACGAPLFSSDTKYDSGSGWPSFFAPVSDSAIGTTVDESYGMKRTEIHCAKCGGHLGHVFEDGPAPTGLRYCMNSAALRLIPKDGAMLQKSAEMEKSGSMDESKPMDASKPMKKSGK